MPANNPDKPPSPPLNLAHIEASLNSIILVCETFKHKHPSEVNKLAVLFQKFHSNIILKLPHLQPPPPKPNPLLDEIKCYAQDERKVRLGTFECEGGSSDVCLATAASDEE